MTPREEIEKKLSNLERVREVAYGDFKRIREILSTHELVPIDNTEEAKETVTDSIGVNHPQNGGPVPHSWRPIE